MGKIAYYDKNYNRIEVEISELVELARKGVIDPDTYIEMDQLRRRAQCFPILAKVFKAPSRIAVNSHQAKSRLLFNRQNANNASDASDATVGESSESTRRVDGSPNDDQTELGAKVDLEKKDSHNNNPDNAEAPIAFVDEKDARASNESASKKSAQESSDSRLCAKCGEFIADSYAFCPKCGATRANSFERSSHFCPRCGTPSNNARFCARCGASLNAEGTRQHSFDPNVSPKNGFLEANKICWIKWLDISGRASRSEFWYFILGCLVIYVILSVFSAGVLGFFWLVVTLLPSITATVRRLHDADISGAWALLYLIPFGGIVLLFMCALCDSTPGANQYGGIPVRY